MNNLLNSSVRSDLEKIRASRQHLAFIKEAWQNKSSPFLIGRHTREITTKLDQALKNYQQGISSYLIVTVPFRHGKSDIVSRYFPPFVFGKMPDTEIILVSYTSDLAERMSRDAIKIMQSSEYAAIFNSRINPKACSGAYWEIDSALGKLSIAGLGGGVTGKGAQILIIDDYLKNRAEAESITLRDKQFESFSNDLMTRLAPVHIVIILATRWHTDDVIGRILRHMKEDPDYPQFDVMKFPARDEEGKYLFLERFNENWYKFQFSSLGTYAASALLQCDPVQRGGNLLKIENIKIENSFPENLRYVRFWDLASTEKERVKDDPDYTVGTKMAVQTVGGIDHIYIADVRRVRAEAPERNKLMVMTAKMDGMSVSQGVESVAGYKDTYTTLKDILDGISSVVGCSVSKDKIIRAAPLEPIFEAGNIHIFKGEWNQAWIDEVQIFPSGAHDDQVDSLSGGYELAKSRMGGFEISSSSDSDFDDKMSYKRQY